jgi:hypothetical protein
MTPAVFNSHSAIGCSLALKVSYIPNAPGNPNVPLGYPFSFHHLIRKPVPTFRGDGVYLNIAEIPTSVQWGFCTPTPPQGIFRQMKGGAG